ncbi:hypothetical protein D9M68_826220 [compost metagenome]
MYAGQRRFKLVRHVLHKIFLHLAQALLVQDHIYDISHEQQYAYQEYGRDHPEGELRREIVFAGREVYHKVIILDFCFGNVHEIGRTGSTIAQVNEALVLHIIIHTIVQTIYKICVEIIGGKGFFQEMLQDLLLYMFIDLYKIII